MNYYILSGNETKGPFTINQLKTMWASGAITAAMQCCQEGDAEWMPLSVLQPLLEPEQQYSPETRRFLQSQTLTVRTAKSRGVYIILGLFFGCLGIHNFYAGYHGRAAAQLIITVLLGWFAIGLIITGLWALIEICTVSKDSAGEQMS